MMNLSHSIPFCSFCQSNCSIESCYTLLCCGTNKRHCRDCLFMLHFIDETCIYCKSHVVISNVNTGFYYNARNKVHITSTCSQLTPIRE